MEIIDLRSDTVTKPTLAMRKAMMEAEVGDDVYAEDPTVNRLQSKVAEILGKEASLFVPSGVMANQLALKVNTKPGDEVIVERDSHIFNYETAGAAFLSNVQLNTIKGTLGILKAEQIEHAIRPTIYYNPITSLICLENTHNKAGGTIYPIEDIRHIHALAKEKRIALHLDGARIWNASVATGIAPLEYAKYFDTISVCFSKGLGSPVGSAIAGSKEIIELARKYRKIFGGGMRQAGILAAGALYAIEHNIERLKEDHENAHYLSTQLADIQNIYIDIKSVRTNIVIIDISKRSERVDDIIAKLKHIGILISAMDQYTLRAVTHMDVNKEQIIKASKSIKSVLEKS